MPPPIKPIKRLGQNFLQDPNTVRRIVGTLQATAADPVVEIGPGTGALTGLLSATFPRFTAIEVDERAVAYLQAAFPTVAVEQGDVLQTNWADRAASAQKPLHVIGNLPYYITSEILFGLLDATPHIAEAVLMMQREVAERLIAVPRTKAYGILSIIVQLYAKPTLSFTVSPNVFYPRPAVTSAVVHLDFQHRDPALAQVDPAFLRTVVRAAFNQRRKTLRNSLHRWTKELQISLPHGWEKYRAEALSPGEFVALAQYLHARTVAS